MNTSTFRPRIRRWLASPLGLCAMACQGDSFAFTQPPSPAVPSRLELVSGNNQVGKTYGWLPEPFVVRATDEAGRPIPRVIVTWHVASGEGAFRIGAQDVGPHATTVTNTFGEVEVWFRPQTLGEHTVTATQPNVPFVPFTTDVRTLVIGWWGEFLGGNISIPIGIAVEWHPWFEVPARIRSTQVPAGGESFDTGEFIGTPFRFVPGVVGTWTYVVEYLEYPGVEIYTLTVQ
jgi:hypothetical protein